MTYVSSPFSLLTGGVPSRNVMAIESSRVCLLTVVLVQPPQQPQLPMFCSTYSVCSIGQSYILRSGIYRHPQLLKRGLHGARVDVPPAWTFQHGGAAAISPITGLSVAQDVHVHVSQRASQQLP